MDIQVVKDHKKEIEFWISAISNPDINNENKKLLNQCLQVELNRHLFPPVLFLKTDPPIMDKLIVKNIL